MKAFKVLLAFSLIALLPLIFYERGYWVIEINQWHGPLSDPFFKYITYLGDGLVYGILALIFIIFKRFGAALYVGITAVLQTIFVHIFKRWLTKTAILEHLHLRPKGLFKSTDVQLHFVEGVKIYDHGSFPSGHTATAFAIATLLLLLYNKNNLGVLFFILAALVGLSRVYLSLHFLLDIYVGAIFGFLAGILAHKISLKTKLLSSENRILSWRLISVNS